MVERARYQKNGILLMTNPILENIRRSLGRTAQTPIEPRPAIYGSRQPESLDSEADRFLEEIRKLSGVPQKLSSPDLDSALRTLVREQDIHRATVWETPRLRQLGITEILSSLDVGLVSPNASKSVRTGALSWLSLPRPAAG